MLAAVMALLLAVAVVALLLHRRRRRWARDSLPLDAASTLAKTTLYGGSHSSRTDDDGSNGGGKGAAGKSAALAPEAAAGLASAGEDPATPGVCPCIFPCSTLQVCMIMLCFAPQGVPRRVCGVSRCSRSAGYLLPGDVCI